MTKCLKLETPLTDEIVYKDLTALVYQDLDALFYPEGYDVHTVGYKTLSINLTRNTQASTMTCKDDAYMRQSDTLLSADGSAEMLIRNDLRSSIYDWVVAEGCNVVLQWEGYKMPILITSLQDRVSTNEANMMSINFVSNGEVTLG